MNISWLEDFLVLASVGNFSRAAEDRHMTQPAFGRRVRALEEWLGTELFDRSTQPVKLTEAGQWFQAIAPELLAEIARLPGLRVQWQKRTQKACDSLRHMRCR